MTTTDTDAPERIAIDPDYVPDHSQHFGTLVKYIRADLAKPRVKPLVWVTPSPTTDGQWQSECGFYDIEESILFIGHVETGIRFETDEAAIAAANAHREAYVLAQLEEE